MSLKNKTATELKKNREILEIMMYDMELAAFWIVVESEKMILTEKVRDRLNQFKNKWIVRFMNDDGNDIMLLPSERSMSYDYDGFRDLKHHSGPKYKQFNDLWCQCFLLVQEYERKYMYVDIE